jgi:hypothetical protein
MCADVCCFLTWRSTIGMIWGDNELTVCQSLYTCQCTMLPYLCLYYPMFVCVLAFVCVNVCLLMLIYYTLIECFVYGWIA